jgi:hypothetical protein
MRNERGSVVPVLLGVLVLAIAAIPIVLHFAQKRHDVLPFTVQTAFPPGESIVPGEAFAATLIALIEHELDGGTGWRPNDFFLWGRKVMADNNANRQLGIIQAVRESVRVLKDHLTKVSATEFDDNLVAADTLFRNDAEKFWFPSAEGRYRQGARALRRYVKGLRGEPLESKPITGRNVELIRLFQNWTDLLGDAHANLFKEHRADGRPLSTFKTDDYFYHAQGFAHVMHHLCLALRRDYQEDLVNRPTVSTLLDEVADALGRAAVLKPLVVLNGAPSSIVANHRRNLDVYIVEARQKMYSIREELEK